MMTEDYAYSNSIRVAVKQELQNTGQYSKSLWDYLVELYESSSQSEIAFWSEMLATLQAARPSQRRTPVPTEDVDY